MLRQIAKIYQDMPLGDTKTAKFRYYFANPRYSYCDGIVLRAMIRLIRPQRLIEVGCGYSSAMTLDTNEIHFENKIDLTFIDPDPGLLLQLAKPKDRGRITVIESKLQDIDPTFFECLDANDFFFVDSSHVSKVNSDVNFIFFEVLPRLKKGVYIHFHDIFYPFEYPKEWIYEGRIWQEAYLLRALLQDNPNYRIVYFQDMMFHRFHSFFEKHMPLCLKMSGGNIWLQKVN